jgi:hypothetical protein
MLVSPEVALPSAAPSTSPPGPAPTGAPTTSAPESALAPSAIERRSRLDLASPQATVETQLELLRGGRDSELRTTFLPSVSVTSEAIETCKRRVRSVPVRPDWEMAEDRVEQGHRVRRVSMFGKSMTGFHEMGRAWLADAVWCVPVGLP